MIKHPGRSSPPRAASGVTQDPPRQELDALFALYNQGKLSAVLHQAEALVQSFPKSFILWRLLGAVNFGLERFDQAARALRQVCRLVPGYPDVHSDLGVALRNQGKLDEAIAAFQRAIAIKNDHPNAHTNLGLAFFDQGKLEKAIEAYRRAIAINPTDSVAYGSLGLAFFDQGKPAEAIIAYQRAIAINPKDAVAHANLGLALADQGKLDEAIKAYRHALVFYPGDPTINLNLGVALQKQGKLDEAIFAYQRAIAIKPLYADAYYNLGLALFKQGKLGDAIAAYHRAISIKPDHAEAYSNLGAALGDDGKLDDAIAACHRAIALKPNHADTYLNLGVALRTQRKLDEAASAYQRAITINPNHADSYYNLANALRDQGKLDEAIAAYQRAIAIKTDNADAYSNLGVAFYDQGKLDDAVAAYQRAVAINPNHADAHWNLSLALLTQGHLTSGWSEHEWRWNVKELLLRPRLASKPLWLGIPPLQDRTILLWGEQGLGDQIQFARYATCISELGARVILEVNDELVGLLSNLRGVTKIVGASTPVPDNEFDFHCPLMSLPHALRTCLSTIPDVPRLTAHMKDVPRWAKRAPSSMPKIGIAWSGNPKHKNDRNRSVALSQLATILTPHVSWISLQKEVRDADRAMLDSAERIHHFGDQLNDFLDTAALCERCDLVISVDTSIAHLAATLGRPVWLLLPFAADWRWLHDRDDSPWYPTMKLYRQQQIGDWEGVFQRVKVDLHNWLTQR